MSQIMTSKAAPICSVLGLFDDAWAGLTDTARQRVASADLLIGTAHNLALLAEKLKPSAEQKNMEGALSQVYPWAVAALAAGQNVVILTSGDPLCHGLASSLVAQFKREKGPLAQLDVVSNLSSLQLACARFKEPWQNISIASCHTRDAGEWVFGATSEHGLYPALRAIARHTHVFVLTSPANSPARLARALLAIGYVEGEISFSVACRLQSVDEQLFPDLSLSDAAQREFASPNVILVQRKAPENKPSFGFEDAEYLQRTPEKGLITKQEVRVLSLAKLRLHTQAILWDIGAGSGSLGLEAAQIAMHGHVWAIEKNAEDAANARANAQRLRLSNYTLQEGKAPQHLAQWPDPDAIFIGGSGGELADLIALALARLRPGGRLVMNFVTLENLATATTALGQADVSWDVVQLQASRSQAILHMHRLAAQNPVWVVSALKPREP